MFRKKGGIRGRAISQYEANEIEKKRMQYENECQVAVNSFFERYPNINNALKSFQENFKGRKVIMRNVLEKYLLKSTGLLRLDWTLDELYKIIIKRSEEFIDRYDLRNDDCVSWGCTKYNTSGKTPEEIFVFIISVAPIEISNKETNGDTSAAIEKFFKDNNITPMKNFWGNF